MQGVADILVQIPGFEIQRELGRGANSVVYKARQAARFCALKLPRTRGRWTRSVYQEAVALARVHNPGLPEVFEVGEVEGLPYLAMELVEGETLADRLERGPLPEVDVFRLAAQLLRTLRAVHDAGLVHRDVKPRNIVLESANILRLVDFGFATPIERLEGGGAGTPRYAAPEQMCVPSRVDARTDLFAVGRVLYECFTGTLPEEGEAPIDSVAGVAGTRIVLAGLLASSPDDRYPDARSVLSDLEIAGAGRTPRGPKAYEALPRPARLVAREAELDSCLRAWEHLGPSGGAVVVLRGTRGSGKTRLLTACATTARASARGVVAALACREGDPPLATLRRLLESWFGGGARRTVPSGPGLAALKAAAARHLAPLVALIAPSLAAELGVDPATVGSAPAEFAEGATEFFARLLRGSVPVLLTLDDFQWIDPASREVIVRLAHRIGEVPLLLALSARAGPEGARALEPFRTMDSARLSTIDLAPLTEGEVAAMIAGHLSIPTAEPELVQRIAALADGTPLGVLEVLGAFLDSGVVRPVARAWSFDSTRAERVRLPEGALVLLGHRLADLPEATRRVLEVAAALGANFEDALLGRIVGVDTEDVGYGLAQARRAGLLESDGTDHHRFVHDSLREMLLADMAPARSRAVHQRVAEELDARGNTSLEDRCARAVHYASGEVDRTPKRAFAAARDAAEAALARYDNETALRFFGLAGEMAPRASERLDAPFHRDVGEAHLRLGNLTESLAALERALAVAGSPSERAALHGRISWAHQAQSDPDRAWEALDQAFRSLGLRMPKEDPRSVVDTAAEFARAGLRKLGALRRGPGLGRADIELVCDLHYQNARLGLEYGKPMRLLQSSFQSLEISVQLGPSRALARSRAVHGFVLAVLGRKGAARRELEAATNMAGSLADPLTEAFCAQVRAMTGFIGGDFESAFEQMGACLRDHGHWLELNEYCHNAVSIELWVTMQGRSREAWSWVERAMDRLRRTRYPMTPFADHLFHRAGAALASLGQEPEPWLAEELKRVAAAPLAGKGFYHVHSWGPRLRCFLERGELGAPFEEVVRAFEAEKHAPGSSHPALSDVYLTIAHARIHQALRADEGERHEAVRRLSRAAEDLRAAATLPLVKAHSALVRGCLAWFQNDAVKARKLLAEAAELGAEQSAPWVLYGVARMRAHALRAAGHAQGARDEARVAEMFAREHGAKTRSRWVCEEFDLPEPVPATPSASSRSRSSSRSRKQLSALLQIARTRAPELRPDQQAAEVLDDLLRDVGAERGHLVHEPEVGAPSSVALGRTRRGEFTAAPEGWRAELLRGAREGASPADVEGAVDPKRVMVAPLVFYERVVGAVLLERGPEAPPFGAEERELFTVLTHQVPVALELARLLREREQLQSTLQQAQKMEAVGQLAGGIAQDFNNMLTTIQSSLDILGQSVGGTTEANAEIEQIAKAARRAGQLTRQLLAISRHQPVAPVPHDPNELLAGLENVLRRVVGGGVHVALDLTEGIGWVKVDRGSFEQAIVHLALNARDAMPEGGSLIIKCFPTLLDEAAVRRGARHAGQHVACEVIDTGRGMAADLIERAFEPFFTTKPSGRGAGIGLATVYAFAKNSGGYVEVDSEVGRGTTVRLFLPETDERRRPSRPAHPATTPAAVVGNELVLVVDDEQLVARSIRRILERSGYRVLVADGGESALEIVAERGPEISIFLLDVMMPGMSGPDLGRRLAEMLFSAKILYMSGFAEERVAEIDPEQLLQKPFEPRELLRRLRGMLDS